MMVLIRAARAWLRLWKSFIADVIAERDWWVLWSLRPDEFVHSWRIELYWAVQDALGIRPDMDWLP